MVHFILITTIISVSGDSLNLSPSSAHKSYTKDIIISAGLGVALGAGAYFCHNKAESAYEEYKSDTTMKQTVKDWNTIVKYEGYRNVPGVDAMLFIGRAVYYQLKNVRGSRTTSYLPGLEVRYAHNNKLIVGIKQKI